MILLVSRLSLFWIYHDQAWVDRGLARAREAQRSGLDSANAREAAARDAALADAEERLKAALSMELKKVLIHSDSFFDEHIASVTFLYSH